MLDQFQNTIARDFYHLFCGDMIARGGSREVYECRTDKGVVIKFETGGQSFNNVLEWENWLRLREAPDIKKWLCPCVDISPCGTVLLMKRTTPATKFPSKLPRFITDRKPDNFGMLDGNLVLHDYPLIIHNVSSALTKASIRVSDSAHSE